jgi:iron complex outermembrane recepter protein
MRTRFSVLALLLFIQTSAVYADDIEVLIVEGRDSSNLKTIHPLKNNRTQFKKGLTEANDILTGLPGLQIDSRSNFAQDTRISLRGFGARSAFGIRGIDLVMDGIPISTPDGQGQLSSVQLNRVEQVQIITGPIASLYGNSPGGVISLESRIPEKSGVDLQYSQSDQEQENALIEANWKKNDLAIASQFNRYDSDTDRPHSKARHEQGSVAIYYTSANDWNWIIKQDVTRYPVLEDPLGLTPQQFEQNPFQENTSALAYNTRKQVDNQQTSMSLRKSMGNTRWQFGLWKSEREITQYLGFAGDALTSAGGVVDLNRDLVGFNAVLTQDFFWFDRPWQWSLGGELAQMQDERLGFVNNLGVAGELRRDEQGEVNNHDAYSIIRVSIADNFSTFAGLRYSRIDFSVNDFFVRTNNAGILVNPDDSGDKKFSEHAYAAGFDYSFAEGWSLFSSLGVGYETPTLTEMAYKTHNTGLNTDLSASHNQQFEWGTHFTTQDWLWQISQFLINTDDEIIVDQSINGRTSFRNAQQTQRQGVELYNRYQLNEYWQGSLSIQYLEAEFTQGQWNHNQLPGSAKKVYQGELQYFPLGNDHFILRLSTQYRDRVATSDNNLVFARSWQIWDFSIQGKTPISKLNWWARINNLTDKIYVGSVVVNQTNGRSFEPGLSRHGVIGLTFNF